MTGEVHYTVLPYAAREERKAEGAEASGYGEIKVRMLVPGNLPAPKEIVGVVLTPEVSFCEQNAQAVEVFGWLDTQVFYEAHQQEEDFSAPEERAEGLAGDADTIDSGLGVAENVAAPDDYFLDLAKAGQKQVLEVMGQEKQFSYEQLLQFKPEIGENPSVFCLTQRVPFNLKFSLPADFAAASTVNPLVRNVECAIRGGRVIDYQVSLDFWPMSEVEAAQAVEAADGLPAATAEEIRPEIEAAAPAEDERGLEPGSAVVEAGKWQVEGIYKSVEAAEADVDRRAEEAGEAKVWPAEEPQVTAAEPREAPAPLVVEIPLPGETKKELGIAYRPSTAPRRPSQRGSREQRPKIEVAEEVRMPRPLARLAKDSAAEQPAQTGTAEPESSARSRSGYRKRSRQVTVMRYQVR